MTGRPIGVLLLLTALALDGRLAAAQNVSYFPANGATGVNPDTHLVITCPDPPALAAAGTIRIYDAADDTLVDTLDLALPPGPTTGPGALAGRVPYSPVPYEYAPGRWEYDSRNARDGSPVDVSARHPASKQLNQDDDAQAIANYRHPAWVLGGWSPAMAPVVLTAPSSVTVARGQAAILSVSVAAIPDVSYQWIRNGRPIAGAIHSTIRFPAIRIADSGAYTVRLTNAAGTTTTRPATLTVK